MGDDRVQLISNKAQPVNVPTLKKNRGNRKHVEQIRQVLNSLSKNILRSKR